MSNADRTRDLGGKPHSLISVEDLLIQLDRVAASSALGYDQDGLDRLMAWMASDDPTDPGVTEGESGARSEGRPKTGKILIAGGHPAGAVDFITEICDFSAPTEFAVPARQTPTTQHELHNLFFGRITLSDDLQLYTVAPPDSVDPHVWDALGSDALGALVLANPRSLADCYPALNYLDHCGMPYVLALRGSSALCPYDLAEIREALRLTGDTPILFWEPGRRVSSGSALIAVVEAALERRRAEATAGGESLDEELSALTLLTQLELLLQ